MLHPAMLNDDEPTCWLRLNRFVFSFCFLNTQLPSFSQQKTYQWWDRPHNAIQRMALCNDIFSTCLARNKCHCLNTDWENNHLQYKNDSIGRFTRLTHEICQRNFGSEREALDAFSVFARKISPCGKQALLYLLISQLFPIHGEAQTHSYCDELIYRHVPPFLHGLFKHGEYAPGR